ncbi:ParA family protein, partial [Staphylococcus hominis]|uniref:ParA family protein n=1 Tax=Staphylococcus hominis TaxID=1290 RepID=UPI001E53323A
MTAKTITFGNFKGGTGKTTNATMVGYELSNQGKHTLLIVLDPQANATNLYLKTKINFENDITSFI